MFTPKDIHNEELTADQQVKSSINDNQATTSETFNDNENNKVE